MGKARTCDICNRPCKEHKAKLFYSPLVPGKMAGAHSQYTHHLDVGECCTGGTHREILKIFHFRERKSMSEYQESRKNGNSVAEKSEKDKGQKAGRTRR